MLLEEIKKKLDEKISDLNSNTHEPLANSNPTK